MSQQNSTTGKISQVVGCDFCRCGKVVFEREDTCLECTIEELDELED